MSLREGFTYNNNLARIDGRVYEDELRIDRRLFEDELL